MFTLVAEVVVVGLAAYGAFNIWEGRSLKIAALRAQVAVAEDHAEAILAAAAANARSAEAQAKQFEAQVEEFLGEQAKRLKPVAEATAADVVKFAQGVAAKIEGIEGKTSKQQ
jgi:esterase/lipase